MLRLVLHFGGFAVKQDLTITRVILALEQRRSYGPHNGFGNSSALRSSSH